MKRLPYWKNLLRTVQPKYNFATIVITVYLRFRKEKRNGERTFKGNHTLFIIETFAGKFIVSFFHYHFHSSPFSLKCVSLHKAYSSRTRELKQRWPSNTREIYSAVKEILIVLRTESKTLRKVETEKYNTS